MNQLVIFLEGRNEKKLVNSNGMKKTYFFAFSPDLLVVVVSLSNLFIYCIDIDIMCLGLSNAMFL